MLVVGAGVAGLLVLSGGLSWWFAGFSVVILWWVVVDLVG